MSRASIIRLLLLSILWGGSFLFIRITAPALGPVVVAELRVLLAGLALALFAAATHRQLELRARWRQYLIIGVINSAIPFALIATAELHLTASLAAVLNATSPLFGAVIAALWLRDPLTPRKLAGLALGVAGVAILTGVSLPHLSPAILLAVGASLAAAASYGLSGNYLKARMAGAPSIGLATCSQLAAALVLAPIVPFALPPAWPNPTVVACMLALALLSTALAYILYFRLVTDIGPMQALTVTFLTPLFGVFWGALLLNEPITIGTIAGGLVVLAGTALVTGIRLPQRSRAVQNSVG